MKIGLSHLNQNGEAHMVDVGEKPVSKRTAIAKGVIHMKGDVLRLIQEGQVLKGDVLAVARVAGIMAAKKTSDLIPLCHPLAVDSVKIDFQIQQEQIAIQATVRSKGKTGVEMEALTAVSVAALTIYDMAKAIDKGMTMGPIYLEKKSGGKSGDYVRSQP